MSKEIIWNRDKGRYELSEYTDLEQAKHYLNELALTNVIIQNDDDYNAVRKSRTLVNKEHDEIADKRKGMTAVVLSLFEPVLKELEKYAQDKSDELTRMMNAYKPLPPREKKTFKLEATFDNAKALEKVKKYALKYGAKIKGE